MRSIGRAVATGLVTVVLAVSGAVAWAADDVPTPDDSVGSGRLLGPPEWAALDCPAGLDPTERDQLRTEHRATMDQWRSERLALADQAGTLTPEERAVLLEKLDALRAEHQAETSGIRGERQAQMSMMRGERLALRDGIRSQMDVDGAGS